MYKGASKNVARLAEKKSRKNSPKRKKGWLPRKELGPKPCLNSYKVGDQIKGEFVKNIKGGFEVSFVILKGFCPYSERYPKYLDDVYIDRYRGKLFKFTILKVEKKSLIVSRKQSAVSEAISMAKNAKSHDKAVFGMVTSVAPFGVFVDIGGLEGLVHDSQMSEGSIPNIGSRIKVKILSINEDKQEVELSLKHSAAIE